MNFCKHCFLFISALLLFSSCSQKDEMNALLRSGTRKMFAHDYAGAHTDFNKAIKINPKFDSVYWFRGNVFKLQLDYKPAIADYSKAIELNPLFVNAYNSRSTLRGITGDRVGEEADLNKAIAIDSTFHMAWYNRGNFWYDKGNHEKAIADYSQAIVIKPDYSSAFFNRANSYDEMKQYALGLADYDSYFKYQQDSLEPELVAEAYHLRASDKFILADTAGACADWKTADEQGFVRAKAKLQQFCK